MSNSKQPNKIKTVLSFVGHLLAVAQWLPFIGKYKPLLAAISALIATLGGVTMCNGESPELPAQQKQAEPIPEPTQSPTPAPTATPTPKPTPRPPRIIIDRAITASEPFEFRYTAPFQHNVSLWADKYRLGYLGKAEDGTFISRAVYLNTPGKRRLSVRDAAGKILAEQIFEVK